MANKDEKKHWWGDEKAPLAIACGATVAALATALINHRQMPPDGFGTLILIAVLASVAAADNCRDLKPPRRSSLMALSIACFVGSLAIAAIAYGSVPGLGAGWAR